MIENNIAEYFKNKSDEIFASRKSDKPGFLIYQLDADNPNNIDIMFKPLDYVENHADISKISYKMTYADDLETITSDNMPDQSQVLECIYNKFNDDNRPADFKSRSASVSDIFILFDNNTADIFYTEFIGFTHIISLKK